MPVVRSVVFLVLGCASVPPSAPRVLAAPAAPAVAPPPEAKQAIELTEIEGSVDNEMNVFETRRTLRAVYPDLRRCYEVALSTDHAMRGTVHFAIDLVPDGSVSSAKVTAGTLKDSTMLACAVGVVEKVKFPPPPLGVARVRYGIEFKSQGF